MQRRPFHHALIAAGATIALGCVPCLVRAQATTEISFFFPVAVGGPIAKYIDDTAAAFSKHNPAIKVTPIYAGSYQDTIVKALTALKSGQPPVTSVLLSTDMFTLIDEDAIVPFDGFVKTADDKAWLDSFYKAFMLNSQTGGKTWGVPFQRSTIVMYYNKEMFKEAGLDPNKPPASWAEMADAAKKLTKKDAAGKVTTYGVQIPSSGFPYWLFQALAIQNGVVLANDSGNAVRFNDPKVIEALEYWVDLTRQGVHPPGVVEWGTTPKDFFEKKVAMMWTTTGNLTNVKNNAKFDFGVAMLPAKLQKGSPTGGGNFYIFKKSSPAQQEAAFKFIQWITQPEQAARWSVETGYVATSEAAYATDTLRKYGRDFPPALVARDQLPFSLAEFSTHDNQRVTKALNDGLQAALTGSKTPAQAMADAQREADRLLRSYK
ncbi:ABC transporter substrate-binding protein [Pseudorhodoferax sp. Leaf267]|uniref:ABC transporter substrate-binding protein n=1 Tax=Pseudorhodoferax sp. Leaf267 TaxID=1736316 RepID=UPI0006F4059F|nr:ABC transporter substrate-binding protein [Pseudorhodoferax sp. Leaf267]KQP13063.1 ABC transporter substrate-binding protein [Pseudorhodoferax sp. Leaf267]